MRNDMTHVVNQGGNAHKFRPYVGRQVRCIPVVDASFSYDASGACKIGERLVEGTEPLETGRVRMRDKRIGWGDEKNNLTFKPVRRWLAAQDGRPWDAVYAELSGKYLPRLGQSLREWVAGEVSQDCWRNAEGELVFNSRYGGVHAVDFNDFYVDPDTGVLLASNRNLVRRRWKDIQANKVAERAKLFRQGKSCLQYHKREGCWFEVTTGSYSQVLATVKAEQDASISGYRRSKGTFDTFAKRVRINMGDWEAKELYGDKDLYSVSHRALSRRDCERLKLD